MIEGGESIRKLQPHWNDGMIAASIAISLLGAFTSTQLMCQARVSLRLSSVLVWTLLGSLTFGFCSIWSLHFVAMLAYELDLEIGINVPCTVASAVLAVLFTFGALGSDLLWETYTRERDQRLGKHGAGRSPRRTPTAKHAGVEERGFLMTMDSDTRPLLRQSEDYMSPVETAELDQFDLLPSPGTRPEEDEGPLFDVEANGDSCVPAMAFRNDSAGRPMTFPEEDGDLQRGSTDEIGHCAYSPGGSEHSSSRRSLSLIGSVASSYGLSSIMNIAYRSTSPAKNAFLATGEALYSGCTRKNITKGFFWSLAITTMHYVGLLALKIPQGYCILNYGLVILSALISWSVCIVGCILMPQMESHLGQQVLFSVVATSGVACMHFTGMRAATFYSSSPPSTHAGYPPALAIAIVSIAVTTCITANGLLAHAATVSRNKLAEIVWTRRKLWRTIAQKENAEAAAAARSDFIASASHEIRTPLHHLQGYSDLLGQTELTEEGRLLLLAIQRAMKTLSLITNNVLDWSKLERGAESTCRPVALDIRAVCESILILLPNKDDETEVELLVVVKPSVPSNIFLDENCIHRILMNLLSNALKFTRQGYILLEIDVVDERLQASVRDTGSGVPEDFLPLIFEPFKQAQTRGSQRGTGLGLSIVRHLLKKMGGEIAVESRHDVECGGSNFTISIPIPTCPPSTLITPDEHPKVALFHGGNQRALEGLRIAWENFGFAASVLTSSSELEHQEWKYIWADIPFLKAHPKCRRYLLSRSQSSNTILIPYDNQHALLTIPEIALANHVVTLQRPLCWHAIQQRVISARSMPVERTVRFKSTVDIVADSQTPLENPKAVENTPRYEDNLSRESTLTEEKKLVLLVEDNLINQQLGSKMLTTLGYSVRITGNGLEALTFLRENAVQVDAILMDQSMPLMDGVTATREIRALEASGLLGLGSTSDVLASFGRDGPIEGAKSRIPIIAVTAVVNADAKRMFKEAGADDFLGKPLGLGTLEGCLRGFLDGR